MKAPWKAALAAAVLLSLSAVANAEEIRLLFTSQSPAGSRNVAWFTEWAQRVNAQSAGTLRIEVQEIGPLANFGNAYNRVLDDVVQRACPAAVFNHKHLACANLGVSGQSLSFVDFHVRLPLRVRCAGRMCERRRTPDRIGLASGPQGG